MKYPHLFSRLYNQPLLLNPDKARVIESVFRNYIAGGIKNAGDENIDLELHGSTAPRNSMAALPGARNQAKPYQLSDGGVAIIPVIGTLVQRSSWMDAASGMTGYPVIKSKLDSALQDPEVKAILLDVDSGGGEANGAFDLADHIYNARSVKPIWAIANEAAYSAAFAIASSAEKLFMPRTAGVGSVGVIAMHVDQSARNEKAGLTYTAIIAGDKKAAFSSMAPLGDVARSDMQDEVNRLYGIFAETAARNLGIDVETVLGTQAGLLNPDQAIAIGFAHGIATFDQTLAQLEATVSKKPDQIFSTTARQAVNRKEALMDQPQAQASASGNADQTAAIEQTRTEAHASGLSEGILTGANQERTRIKSIVQSEEAAGRVALANHIAFNTAMSIEDARAMLAASPAETAPAAAVNPLAAAMAQTPNPKVGADAGGSDNDANNAEVLAKQIIAAGK